jgi:Thrombospondin type 3 repeat
VIEDADGAGIKDDVDNCPAIPNLDQADNNGDGIGDSCDPEDDYDGVNDDVDNCPVTASPDQSNVYEDGFGDTRVPVTSSIPPNDAVGRNVVIGENTTITP